MNTLPTKTFLAILVVVSVLPRCRTTEINSKTQEAVDERKHCYEFKNPDSSSLNIKVLPLIMDPILPGGQRARAYWIEKGGSKVYHKLDPLEELRSFISFYEDASCGYINIEAKEPFYRNEFPALRGGINYSASRWQKVMSGDLPYYREDASNPDNTVALKLDYKKFFKRSDLCRAIVDQGIDEVWVFAYSFAGFYEAMLITGEEGPEGFPTNGPTIKVECDGLDRLVMVGTPDPHSFGHRTEGTMATLFNRWRQTYAETVLSKQKNLDPNTVPATPWDFYVSSNATLGKNVVGCGSIHYPPNTRCMKHQQDNKSVNEAYCREDDEQISHEYGYGWHDRIKTACPLYVNYPDIPQRAMITTVSCCDWNCSEMGYYKWWWTHLPRSRGEGPTGLKNNWWRYVFDTKLTDQVIHSDGQVYHSENRMFNWHENLYRPPMDEQFDFERSIKADCPVLNFKHLDPIRFQEVDYKLLMSRHTSSPLSGTWHDKIESCLENCNRTNVCVGVMLDRNRGQCQMYNRMVNPGPVLEDSRYVSFVKTKSSIGGFSDSNSTNIYDGSKFICPAFVDTITIYSSIDNCLQACKNSPSCTGVTMDRETYHCYPASNFSFGCDESYKNHDVHIRINWSTEAIVDNNLITRNGKRYRIRTFDHPYNDIPDESYPTIEKCLDRCNALGEACQGIVKHRDYNFCALKSAMIPVQHPNPDYFSLIKENGISY